MSSKALPSGLHIMFPVTLLPVPPNAVYTYTLVRVSKRRPSAGASKDTLIYVTKQISGFTAAHSELLDKQQAQAALMPSALRWLGLFLPKQTEQQGEVEGQL